MPLDGTKWPEISEQVQKLDFVSDLLSDESRWCKRALRDGDRATDGAEGRMTDPAALQRENLMYMREDFRANLRDFVNTALRAAGAARR